VPRPIAPAATHTLTLAEPVFSDTDIAAGADDNFTIVVSDGNFAELWSDSSSAFSFDTASSGSSGSTARVPGFDTNVATSFSQSDLYSNVFIVKREAANDAYAQLGTSYHDIGFPVAGDPDTSGFWIHEGVWPTVGNVPVSETTIYDTPADEFLHEKNAMPGISVRRNHSGQSKEYEFQDVTAFSTEYVSEFVAKKRWRLYFRKAAVPE
jgi:hypothetical protein